MLFHLPSGWIDRLPRDELMAQDAGRTIAITLTVRDIEPPGRLPGAATEPPCDELTPTGALPAGWSSSATASS